MHKLALKNSTVTDEKLLPISVYEEGLQNAYCEGHTTSAKVANVHQFDFHGAVIHAKVYHSGSWHDLLFA